VDANYTTEEINTILDKIDQASLKYSNKIYNKYGLGINCVDLCMYYKMYLFKRVIQNWHQNDDGSDNEIYNSISKEQFITIVTTVLNYCK
jgi:hypothetical protein